MRIEGSYKLPGTPETAFATLLDPGVLAECLPGCERLEAVGEGAYEVTMKILLAAISGEFTGKVVIEHPQPPTSYRLHVEAAGRIGVMNGGGEVRLSPTEGGGTLVCYSGDVQMGGTIAAVGQRLLDTTARMVIRRFFEKVASRCPAES